MIMFIVSIIYHNLTVKYGNYLDLLVDIYFYDDCYKIFYDLFMVLKLDFKWAVLLRPYQQVKNLVIQHKL